MAEVPPSDILRGLLTAHVGVSGWELHTGAMPDSPDDVIMLTDTGGIEPNPKWLLDFPSCQIMVRGKVGGYLDTYREAKAVKDLLLGVTPYTTGDGDRVVSITQNGDLGGIGRDENMRPLFVINFALIVEPQVVGNSNRLAL
jgi:hypothetical protein